MDDESLGHLLDHLFPQGEPLAAPEFPTNVVTTLVALDITSEDASELIAGYRSLLLGKRPQEIYSLYIYSGNKNALPVSYNSEWRPFIGRTYGHNPESWRVHFNPGISVLEGVGKALRRLGREIRGGRVFLTSTGAFCVEGTSKIDLLNWLWPERDIVDSVLQVVAERLAFFDS